MSIGIFFYINFVFLSYEWRRERQTYEYIASLIFCKIRELFFFYRSVGVQKDILALFKSLASQQSLKYEKVHFVGVHIYTIRALLREI